MGLIKANEAPVTLTAFSMQDIEQAAKKVLLRARRDADQVLADAKKEGEEIRRLAREEGLKEGKTKGIADGFEEGRRSGHAKALAEHTASINQLVQALTLGLKQLNADREELLSRGIDQVVDLAMRIARRITHQQAKVDPQVLIANLREAMSLAIHAADVRIALHPSQKKTLEAELPHLKMSWPKLEHVELVEDLMMSPGSVRIYTHAGQIDATLEAQLDRLMAEVLPSGDAAPVGAA